MALNPNLNRDAILVYLTLFELMDFSEGGKMLDHLRSAFRGGASRALAESDMQFIVSREAYLTPRDTDSLTVRLSRILRVFDAEAEAYSRERLEAFSALIAEETKSVAAAAGISLDTSPVHGLDPFSHPDSESDALDAMCVAEADAEARFDSAMDEESRNWEFAED